MTKIIRITQCYWCPYISMGCSTELQDVGGCKKSSKSLYGTSIETEKDTWTQTIPDWCELEEAV